MSIVALYPRSIPRCQHIKINGTQCGSPALKGERLCYFHDRWRHTRIEFNKAGSLHYLEPFELPSLEDADSIQVAIVQVLRLIIAKHIDATSAGLLLYGLQVAATNLKAMRIDPMDKTRIVIEPESVAQNALGESAWYPEEFTEQKVHASKPSKQAGVTNQSASEHQQPAKTATVAKPCPKKLLPDSAPESAQQASFVAMVSSLMKEENVQTSP